MVPVEVDPTAVMGSLLAVLTVAHVRARHLRSTAVRLALSDARPDIRRAGVLVAGRHGVARYRRALLRAAQQEESNEVLATLAEVVRNGDQGRRPQPRKLRQWTEGFLAGSDMSGSSEGQEKAGALRRSQNERLLAGVIDALQAIEAVSPHKVPALPAGPASGSLLPAPVWKATPGQLDALAVLASLEHTPLVTRAARRPPDGRGRGPHRRRRPDPEALVDRLAGIAPRAGERADGTGPHGLSSSEIGVAETLAGPPLRP